MAGRFSRNKGYRNEVYIIDHLKEKGLLASRIPLSGGASEKGDVKIEIPGSRFGNRTNEAKFIYGEVKARANEFRGIYSLYTTITKSKGGGIMLSNGTESVVMSYDFSDLNLLGERGMYEEITKIPSIVRVDAILKKLFKIRAWVKDCDFLVIRIDRMPPLFLRYF